MSQVTPEVEMWTFRPSRVLLTPLLLLLFLHAITEGRAPGWKTLPKGADEASESLVKLHPWKKNSSQRIQNDGNIPPFTRVNNCEILPGMEGMREIFRRAEALSACGDIAVAKSLPGTVPEFKQNPTRSCPKAETQLLKLDVSYDNVPQGRNVDGRALILDLETQTTTRKGCSQI
ncbi:uncharacterized protein LOC122263334 [Penaeus japonicus]|uniref:uncharacterized protein LOC122263334 n=1 Tax=Penaeus japonicus TaxID=27405 RepID=UPI001C7165D1|nr:uncharacterized protein LOC122263334 [Penaeus japonicus]